MSYINTYQKFAKAIVEEHEAVFAQLDMKQLKTFIDAIIGAKHIFVHGTGREGISMRGFAMRLAHLGKPTYWLMDDTTIGMHQDDLFIICDGRGDVGIHRRIVQQATKTGAKIAMITALPEGNLAKNYADYILFVHSTVYMDEKHAEKVQNFPDNPTIADYLLIKYRKFVAVLIPFCFVQVRTN